jgi:ribosomal protein S18 acetylase RimI-like enzyme
MTQSIDFRLRLGQISDSAAVARVQVDSWRLTYVGIVSDDYLAHFTYEEQEQDWNSVFASNGKNVIVVVEIDKVVGYAWAQMGQGELTQYDAELASMHLLPNYRGLGIGQKLFVAMMNELDQRGVQSMFLWALEKNVSAHRFYEKLGGVRVGRRDAMIGDCPVVDIAYGWDSLKVMNR